MNIKTILLLTGLSAAGKSTAGKELADRWGWEFVSARQTIRVVAESKGYKRIRHWLAQEGTDSVVLASRLELLRLLGTKQSQNGIVVDDVFDRDMPEAIRITFPETSVFTIAFDVPDETREERMVQRLGSTLEEARAERALIDGFKKEAGIEDVIRGADIHISNEGALDDTVTGLGEGIEELRLGYRQSPERI